MPFFAKNLKWNWRLLFSGQFWPIFFAGNLAEFCLLRFKISSVNWRETKIFFSAVLRVACLIFAGFIIFKIYQLLNLNQHFFISNLSILTRFKDLTCYICTSLMVSTKGKSIDKLNKFKKSFLFIYSSSRSHKK